jgi:hypothetical protein
MENEIKLYGVSSGNGNNGVSHMFADYYVRTNDPWKLVELAALTLFKKPDGVAWAKENVQIDGEAEYTISAVFYDPPLEEGEEEPAEGESWCDNNGAWLIVEVFPEDDPREGRPMYDSLEDCFGDDVALAA